MPARPSTGDRPEEERTPMRLVIDLNLHLLPKDPAEEVSRVLGFWTAWLPKMDLTLPTEQELHDSTHRAVDVLRLIGANATGNGQTNDFQ
jgi:hypothetical protein